MQVSDPAALGPWAEQADVTLGLGSLHLRTKLSEGGKNGSTEDKAEVVMLCRAGSSTIGQQQDLSVDTGDV